MIGGGFRWVVVASVLATACGGSQPNQTNTAASADEGPRPESVEWLYATPGSSGVVKDECQMVLDAIAAERDCAGGVCKHGKALAEDWLKACSQYMPAKVAEVEAAVAELGKRRMTNSSCEQRALAFVQAGCAGKASCVEMAQSWATECGAKLKSPLVVRMVEERVFRDTDQRVRLDTTSCSELFAKLEASLQCKTQFECQDRLAEQESYRKLCRPEGVAVPIEWAIAEEQLVLKAGQPVSPIPVNETTFPKDEPGLLAASRNAKVLQVGQDRVPDLASFVKLVTDSKFALPVFVAKVFPAQGGNELRLGVLFAPDADTFFRRYGSLRIDQNALEKQRIAESVKLIGEAKSAKKSAALSKLVRALEDPLLARHSKEIESALKAADTSMKDTFRWLGQEKLTAIGKTFDAYERALFARRMIKSPLADVDREGQVDRGTYNPAARVSLDELMPESVAAYKDAMEIIIQPVLKLGLRDSQAAAHEEQVRQLGQLCTSARKKATELEKQLMECAFSVKTCSEEEVDEKTEALDVALADFDKRHEGFRRGLLELPKLDAGMIQLHKSCR